MALSPFRALLAAHLQETWNRSAKELGKQYVWLVALVAGLALLLVSGPLLLGAGSLGWLLGGRLEQPVIRLVLGGLLAFLGLGGGVLGGIVGGARQLTWETYRGFPLRLRTLYTAELVAGLGDLLPLILGITLLALLAGVGLGCPSALALVPLVFLEILFTLLALQLLVGGLASALVRRLRLALTVLGIVAWVASTLFTTRLPQRGDGERHRPALAQEQIAQVQVLGEALGRVVATLPTHAAVLSLAKAKEGRWGQAMGLQAYPLAVLLLLMGLGARLLAREGEAEPAARGPAGPERLWSFQGPVEGVGRLHVKTLLGSHLGKFSFLMPLMTVVLLKGPFAQLRGSSSWAIPGAFAYLSLVGNNFAFNQFGLDRHGIKGLLLLPISPASLLKGKLLGLAVHQGLQALVLLLLLALFDRPDLKQLLAGLLLMGCFFLAQTAVGQWTSAWSPRPMARDSLKNNTLPFVVVLLSLATSGLWASLFGGSYALLAWLAPAWLLPGMALLFLLTGAAHWLLLPSAAAYLQERQEKLVEALG